jgi:hypothetical protein
MKDSLALPHHKPVIVTRTPAKSTAILIGYHGASALVLVELAFNIKMLSFTNRRNTEVLFARHEETKFVTCTPARLTVPSPHGVIGPLAPLLVEVV